MEETSGRATEEGSLPWRDAVVVKQSIQITMVKYLTQIDCRKYRKIQKDTFSATISLFSMSIPCISVACFPWKCAILIFSFLLQRAVTAGLFSVWSKKQKPFMCLADTEKTSGHPWDITTVCFTDSASLPALIIFCLSTGFNIQRCSAETAVPKRFWWWSLFLPLKMQHECHPRVLNGGVLYWKNNKLGILDVKPFISLRLKTTLLFLSTGTEISVHLLPACCESDL